MPTETERALSSVVCAILDPGPLAFFALGLASAWVLLLRRRVRDQTEIIRAQMLQEAALEERHRDLLEGTSDIVFSTDLEGRLLAINRAAQDVTGFRRAELLVGSLFDLMPEAHREPARKLLADVAGGVEPPPAFRTAVLARDGRVVQLELSLRLARRDGRPVGFDGIARDVSLRERGEPALGGAHIPAPVAFEGSGGLRV
jgi:PAS domain S-box-containing protein